jgi:hypothetical protein
MAPASISSLSGQEYFPDPDPVGKPIHTMVLQHRACPEKYTS